MQSFLNRLTNLPITGKVICAEKQWLIVDLIEQANEIRLKHPQYYQGKVALQYTNVVDFVTALMAFDGWSAEIFLVPPNVLPLQKDLINWPPESTFSLESPLKNQLTVEPLEGIATRWSIATSGTTGEPKWYSHTFESLASSAKYSNNLQELCWALLYQPFRFAGLQVVLQALLSGADLLDAVEYEPIALTSLLIKHEVTAISATPSLWRQLLMTGQLSALNLRHITLGGEIADQSVLDKLSRLFPKAKLRHIYASTETGVGLVVSDGRAGFPVNWLENSRLPVVLKMSGEYHLLVKPSHAICYSLAEQTDSLGFVDTQDVVEIKGDRVQFIGRSTGVINVGGNKVLPEKVEQVLLQCPEVSQARVYSKKSALMGELVVADITIVNTVDRSLVKQEVFKICKNQLQRFEIPTKINVVEDISHDPSGKLNRKEN